MNKLYPLKFKPILQPKIWGGKRLSKTLNKPERNEPIGESWEVSAIDGHMSVVTNGNLNGKNLRELIEEFPLQLLGEKIYKKYGKNFPLLIKFIDAHEDLSVQLHPNDKLSKERHNSMGKEEMWYIINAEKDSKLYMGLKEGLNKEKVIDHINSNTIQDVIHEEHVKTGDAFHIKPGLIHSIGAGLLLAEIQQSSDITYRLYDWDRVDTKGNSRELHTELSIDAIDYSSLYNPKKTYECKKNKSNLLVNSKYFETSLLLLTKSLIIKSKGVFSIYINVGGSVNIKTDVGIFSCNFGETVLIPAEIGDFSLIPLEGEVKLLQVFPQ